MTDVTTKNGGKNRRAGDRRSIDVPTYAGPERRGYERRNFPSEEPRLIVVPEIEA